MKTHRHGLSGPCHFEFLAIHVKRATNAGKPLASGESSLQPEQQPVPLP